MAKVYCSVAENGIEYRYEESECPIYTKNITWAGHKQPKIIEYLAVQNGPEIRKCLEDAIVKDNQSTFFHKALVKHGHGTRCGFYPLPLIFATERERNRVASDRGVRPPSESWVKTKRYEILEFYRVEQTTKKSFLKKIINFFSSKNDPLAV